MDCGQLGTVAKDNIIAKQEKNSKGVKNTAQRTRG